MKRLVAGLVIALTLGAPAVAHAEQGPGYGGDADSLNVSWNEPKSKAMAAGPPPVPSGGSGEAELTDPERLAMSGDSATLRIDGIGFRGLSEVDIQFGSEDPVAVRADGTGTVVADFPATDAAAPGTTVVAIGRSPSGATRTLVGSVPPLAHGIDLMGLVPWLIAAPVALIAIAALARRRSHASAAPAAPTGPRDPGADAGMSIMSQLPDPGSLQDATAR